MAGIILVAVLGLAVGIVVALYNGLINKKNMVAEAWSGIEAQLKRRSDLIPNVVETVKGYATHERTTFEDLARLRSAGQGAMGPEARAAAESAISAALGRLIAVAEAYPELKASANFQSLQRDLAEIEDQIQLARRYYNGAVRNLNNAVQQFPSNLIANASGFQSAKFFEIENAADRAVPAVSFAP